MFVYTCECFSVFYYMIHLLNKTQEIKIDEAAYLHVEFFLIHNLNKGGFHIMANKIKHALHRYFPENCERGPPYIQVDTITSEISWNKQSNPSQ